MSRKNLHTGGQHSGRQDPDLPGPGNGKGRSGLLRIEDLEIGYGRGKKRHSLSGEMNCNVSGGELVSLMGRNGSGKSTLLRTIAGLQDALGGSILLEGRPVEGYGRMELARILGFVSTEVIRVQGLRVRDLVAMGRYPHTGWFGILSEKDREMVDNAIRLTSLESLAGRDLDELSDGERQRAMIARTLAQDTRILVLDEPTAFLDLTHKYEITVLLGELAGKHGKTVVFSTHDLQLSLREADKIWLMHDGGLLEGAPEDLVLNGQLEQVLLQEGPEGLTVDAGSGGLALRREFSREISVSGEPSPALDWTRKSLERLGFRVELKKTAPPDAALHLSVKSRDGRPGWQLKKSGEKLEFNSIYDLSLFLKTIV